MQRLHDLLESTPSTRRILIEYKQQRQLAIETIRRGADASVYTRRCTELRNWIQTMYGEFGHLTDNDITWLRRPMWPSDNEYDVVNRKVTYLIQRYQQQQQNVTVPTHSIFTA